MGGFFGAVSHQDVTLDIFFGVDYHSHLGTRRGGLAAWDPELGFQREIHNNENAPIRTKFDKTVGEMVGKCCIGSISDTDPQPLLVRSVHGTYAICVVGVRSLPWKPATPRSTTTDLRFFLTQYE